MTREDDASGDETDKEEWDGMVLQLKGLQLMDKREGMQETSTPASVRRALPSSKEEDEEEAEEDESEDEDGERKKTKKKKGKKHAKPQVVVCGPK